MQTKLNLLTTVGSLTFLFVDFFSRLVSFELKESTLRDQLT